jgi:hypothetical protein
VSSFIANESTSECVVSVEKLEELKLLGTELVHRWRCLTGRIDGVGQTLENVEKWKTAENTKRRKWWEMGQKRQMLEKVEKLRKTWKRWKTLNGGNGGK